MKSRVLKQSLSESDTRRVLARIDEVSPFVLGRALKEAYWSGGDELERRIRDPKLILQPLFTKETAQEELERRFTSDFEKLKRSDDWRNLPGGPDSFGIRRQEFYLGMTKNAITQFWSENFFRAGVRLFAGVPLSDVTAVLTANTDAVIAKALEVSSKVLEAQIGRPSCDYCLMASGNYARGEWLPRSDVDMWFVWTGDGETSGRPSFDGRLYTESNGRYFHRLFDSVYHLLRSTDIGGFHLRGPVTVDELEREWSSEPGPVEIRERRNVLNARLVYGVGNVYDSFFRAVARRVYDRKWADHFVSRIIDWQEFSNSRAVEVEESAREGGRLYMSLSYSPGGSRTLMFLHHIAQLMDETPPSEKVVRPKGINYGLGRLGELPRDHPFHATGAEVHTLQRSFNSIGLLCAMLRYRFTDDKGGWDTLGGERLDFLSRENGMPPEEFYKHMKDTLLRPVDGIWRKLVARFKDSGRYRPWREPPAGVYDRVHPKIEGLPEF